MEKKEQETKNANAKKFNIDLKNKKHIMVIALASLLVLVAIFTFSGGEKSSSKTFKQYSPYAEKHYTDEERKEQDRITTMR